MIDRSFIEKIEEMADRTKIINDSIGREYSINNLYPIARPAPDVIEVTTLTGFAQYVNTVHQGEIPPGSYIHIISPEKVQFISHIQAFQERDTFITASPIKYSFIPGSFLDLESFIILLQTQFAQDDTIKNMLELASNISDKTVTTFADDGVAQGVTVKAGIHREANAEVPNPVNLALYRTFAEITQPYSLYVFRMRQNTNSLPSCALFDTGDKKWILEAIGSIKTWLVDNIKKEVPIIG